MPYCHQCGAQTEPETAFCAACGVRLEEQAPVSQPPPSPPPPPAPGGRSPWTIFGGIIMLAVLVAGVVALYDAAANDGEWGESIFGGGEDGAAVTAPSPTAESTVDLVPTVEPTPTTEATPRDVPTVAPATPGYATPEGAIAALLEEAGADYVGDCDMANLDTDVGMQCSFLWEDRVDTLIYVVGFTFSEPDKWLLLAHLSGGDKWVVVNVAEFEPGPQDTVPPWP